MKILLLNPQADAERQISQALQTRGIAVLTAANIEEAWQMLQLHGRSLDLAIIHRESTADVDAGMKLVDRIKSDPNHADLPLLVTTEALSDEECARHQETPHGANAYLRTPFPDPVLMDTVEAILGKGLAGGPPPISLAGPEDAPALDIAAILDAPAPPPPVDTGVAEIQLEPAEVNLSDHLTPPPPADEPVLAQADVAEPDAPDAAEADMPYLFKEQADGQSRPALDLSAIFAEPLGDAVVPGGAAQTPDSETFKKYLLLREQDVAVLSSQLKTAREQIAMLEGQLREERGRTVELTHVTNEQKRRIDEFEAEKSVALESVQSEMSELRFQAKAKADKAKVLESQVRDATMEIEHLKERVRADIRKIRVREKELENRLEIVKKDSEALIQARENKIIELKRKLDLLEFNMDLLQDQHAREKENSSKLRDRLAKAAQVVRVAGGLLDSNKGATSESSSEEAS